MKQKNAPLIISLSYLMLQRLFKYYDTEIKKLLDQKNNFVERLQNMEK